MARPLTADAEIVQSPALPLLLRLKAEGYELQTAADPDVLRVRPIDRLTPELCAELRRNKPELLTLLLRLGDDGVAERRVVFAAQLAAAPSGTVPRFLFRSGVAYVAGVCFSCGDRLPRPMFGRCWRCALAWRLACRLLVPPETAVALDQARVA